MSAILNIFGIKKNDRNYLRQFRIDCDKTVAFIF